MRSVVLALVVSAGVASAQDLVVNGSFESAQQAGPARVAISNLTDWTASGGFMLLEQGVNSTSGTAAHSGTQFVSMGHSGASGDRLSQTLITVPGETYSVSFWARSIQGIAAQQITASAFNTSDMALLGSNIAQVERAEWLEYSFDFTATSGQTDLVFLHNQGGGIANVALDSISVVPAPAAMALCGAAGLMAGRRRR